MAVNSTNFHLVANTTFGNGDYGLKFDANVTTTITTVTITAATAATAARIVAVTGLVVLGTATFSGTTATFGIPVAIVSGQSYYVFVNNGASSFVCDYGTTASDLPSNNTDINFPLSPNAVFQAPYNVVISSVTTGGGNQAGIASITTVAASTSTSNFFF